MPVTEISLSDKDYSALKERIKGASSMKNIDISDLKESLSKAGFEAKVSVGKLDSVSEAVFLCTSGSKSNGLKYMLVQYGDEKNHKDPRIVHKG